MAPSIAKINNQKPIALEQTKEPGLRIQQAIQRRPRERDRLPPQAKRRKARCDPQTLIKRDPTFLQSSHPGAAESKLRQRHLPPKAKIKITVTAKLNPNKKIQITLKRLLDQRRRTGVTTNEPAESKQPTQPRKNIKIRIELHHQK